MILSEIKELVKCGVTNNMIMAVLLQKGDSYQDIFEALKNDDKEFYFGGSTVFYSYGKDQEEDEMNIYDWFEVSLNELRKQMFE